VTPPRPRLRLGVGAIGLLAAVLLSACGGRFQPPAAVVNGHEITQAALVHAVNLRLRQAGGAAAGATAEQATKDLTRQVLGVMIEQQVIIDYARAQAIGVQSSDVDAQVAQITSQVGGQAQFEQALRERGLTLADLRAGIERSLLIGHVEDRIINACVGCPANMTQQQKNQVFLTWIRQEVLKGHPVVNPRYGRLDPTQLTIVPIHSTLG